MNDMSHILPWLGGGWKYRKGVEDILRYFHPRVRIWWGKNIISHHQGFPPWQMSDERWEIWNHHVYQVQRLFPHVMIYISDRCLITLMDTCIRKLTSSKPNGLLWRLNVRYPKDLASRHQIWIISKVAITGTVRPVPSHVVKSVKHIWRLGNHIWNIWPYMKYMGTESPNEFQWLDKSVRVPA